MQGVRPYKLPDGQVLVNFTRIFPIPNVEDFTIGKKAAGVQDTTPVGPGEPWDLAAFERLAEQGNETTLALLDLCAVAGDGSVSVQDIAVHASVTTAQVRGQLAGLTMRLRNPKNGFTQTVWPVDITWLAGGVASYTMPNDFVMLWNQARGLDTAEDLSQNSSTSPSGEAQ